ncbi:unnamed protein product [Closterium sp. Naga37s-1]|nr:unnamed protein product [Closterium sp. Naga37s-1]
MATPWHAVCARPPTVPFPPLSTLPLHTQRVAGPDSGSNSGRCGKENMPVNTAAAAAGLSRVLSAVAAPVPPRGASPAGRAAPQGRALGAPQGQAVQARPASSGTAARRAAPFSAPSLPVCTSNPFSSPPLPSSHLPSSPSAVPCPSYPLPIPHSFPVSLLPTIPPLQRHPSRLSRSSPCHSMPPAAQVSTHPQHPCMQARRSSFQVRVLDDHAIQSPTFILFLPPPFLSPIFPFLPVYPPSFPPLPSSFLSIPSQILPTSPSLSSSFSPSSLPSHLQVLLTPSSSRLHPYNPSQTA